MLKNNGWVLVADGEKALFFENVGDQTAPDLRVVRVAEHELPHDDASVASDRPGRFLDTEHGKSAVDHPDYKRLERERFAFKINDILERAVRRTKCVELVVIAPPSVLGALRRAFSKSVLDRLTHEMAKDFTKLPTDELEARVLASLR